ncbi:hypothetical protein [Clostridium minihomine]|nr:hypothetical protein [Clostridium minihomine]
MKITLTRKQLKDEDYIKIQKGTLTKEQAMTVAKLLFDYLNGENKNE